ncbi:acyl-CoA dehydrogenase family protein [Photorhabdus bodei]|uniref:acyl-CoA dehydrogenase family protein n=1 Tax=Photorhabdus bodei TaxID=2029681 RepID=UPI001E369300|nr:acyl-CoA dehydrogenase family protein [Photorhabdus bodei]MCC8466847.1 acyl-CoA dehydrogenase family protein [Photorhabdus bodei]
MVNFDGSIACTHYGKKWLELAQLFRSLSLKVLDDKDTVLSHLDAPLFDQLYMDRSSSCLERTKMYEVLTYGDPNVLLSCPGPSLSGIIVRELGSTEQQNYFFEYVAQHRARTCMAVTEPSKGSDAGNPSSLLSDDFELNAEKWLVGNGRDATIGTMVVRTGTGPYSIGVILLTPETLSHPKVFRQLLPVVGLQGAGLSHLYFDKTPISEEHILGLHRRPLERGMHAVIKTFYRMRPCVCAMALGSAQALLDFAISHIRNVKARELHSSLQIEIEAIRNLNYRAASKIDDGILDGAAVSLAKACSTEFVEKVVHIMPQLVGTELFLTDIWLQKTITDIQGYEWMEGSLDMQRLNILAGSI